MSPDWNFSYDVPTTHLETPAVGDAEMVWSTKAHNYIIHQAFSNGGCPAANQVLKEASLYTDESYPGFSPNEVKRHAMRGMFQDPWDALQAIVDHIAEKLTKARTKAENGQWRSAFFAMGEAFHTIMDRYSPEHTQNGFPMAWPNPRAWRHSLFDFWGYEGLGNLTFPVLVAMVNEMRAGMAQVTQGLTVPACGAYNWANGN